MTFIVRSGLDDWHDDDESNPFEDEWEAAAFAQSEADRTGEEYHIFEAGIHGEYVTSVLPHRHTTQEKDRMKAWRVDVSGIGPAFVLANSAGDARAATYYMLDSYPKSMRREVFRALCCRKPEYDRDVPDEPTLLERSISERDLTEQDRSDIYWCRLRKAGEQR